MPSHTLKITGISDELLALLDERVRSVHAVGRSEYVRELIRLDVLRSAERGAAGADVSFRDLLAPVHTVTRSHALSDEDIANLVERLRDVARAEGPAEK